MKQKITLLNMISSMLLQLCTTIAGFIIPKIILLYFGSNINGLISSLNQFLNYIGFVEGGITGVIAANLYRPLVEKDYDRISSIVVTAKHFFNKIGLVFIAYAILVSIIYPLAFGLDFVSVSSLSLILSVNIFIQYMFSINLRTLLNADKKVYIVSLTQIVITLLNVLMVYLSVKIYPSIHILKGISGILFILQPIVFDHYTRKFYRINWKAKYDKGLIKDRWSGFAINVAASIHNSTDVTVLTFFSSLEMISVYSVYILVTNGIKNLIMAITNGINPTLGQTYARQDLDEINEKMDLYEYIVFLLTCFFYSVAGLLITPFVMLYTKEIVDAPYYQPVFGVLIIISEALYIIKNPHLSLAYCANKFKEITVPAYIEAALNIVISIVLVKQYGLIGVAIGTIVAMTFRMVYHIYFSKKIIGRPQKIFYRKLIVFAFTCGIGIAICSFCFPLNKLSVMNWIIHAIIYTIIIGIVLCIVSICFFKREVKYFKDYLLKK